MFRSDPLPPGARQAAASVPTLPPPRAPGPHFRNRDLQAAKAQTDNQRGKPFLHNSLKPLDQVDLSTDIERGQGEMFGNDCTGLCGV